VKRLTVAVLALTLLAAAPADKAVFVFDPRIPADNQRMLEAALTEAITQETGGRRATVTISLRVIEPVPDRHALVAP
jgi:hypothetical protein